MEEKLKNMIRKIQMVDISKIHPYENNPRNNDKAVPKIVESIKRYGFNVPITVDKNGTIATGHTRYKAALRLGLKEVPVIYLNDLTKEEIDAWRLVDNKTSELATWDEDKLNLELKQLLDLKIDLSDFGFPGEDKMLEKVHEDNYLPNPPANPKTCKGDIYQLGEHRLICGDATSKADMEALLGTEKIDLVVTDPPYNVDYEGASKFTNGKSTKTRNATRPTDRILNDNMDESSFRKFLLDVFTNTYFCMKSGGVFYVFHSDNHGLSFRYCLEQVGLETRQCIIWEKNSFTMGRQDYQWRHEPVLYGWKEGAAHYFINDRTQDTVVDLERTDLNKKSKKELIDLIKNIEEKDSEATTVIKEDKPLHNDLHPTMKPIRLLARFIANSSRKGEIVLDQFGGSGSTMMACEQTGRKCRMIELDPAYCDVIVDRWEKATGEKAELIRKGTK